MAARKRKAPQTPHEEMEQLIDSAIKAMSARIEGMDDARREMAERELRDYFWCYYKCEELRERIDDEGMMTEGPKGIQENPRLAILHKLTGRKSTMFSQVMRWLPKGDQGDEDPLEEFLA